MYRFLVLFITLIVVVFISIHIGVFKRSSIISSDPEKNEVVVEEGLEGTSGSQIKGSLYGPWIQGRTENNAKEATMATVTDVNGSKKVFMIEDDGYTKMVSEDNQEKYYRGSIADFKKEKWNTYNNLTGSRYYRLKMEEIPIPVSEKNKAFVENATSLLKRVETATQFTFYTINRFDFSNSKAIIQFYRNYFDINLYPLVKRYTTSMSNEELNNTSAYRDLINLLRGFKENGINSHDELIQTMSKIRTTKSRQGFTGEIEGLNTKGDLTDTEATCYINNNEDVLREIAGSIAGVKATPTPGLKYRVFNSYFGLNNPNENQYQGSVNLGPWGTTSWEYGFYVAKMSALKSDANKCSFDSNAINPYKNVGYNWQWIANRKYLVPCILKEGLAGSVAHIALGTQNIADKNAPNYIENNNQAEYYTVEWTGYFNPDVDGIWDFYTASDDGSHLFIYDETNVRLRSGYPEESEKLGGVPGLHGMAGSVRSKQLFKNKSYKILLLFGENGGGDQISFYYMCKNSTRARGWQHAAVVGDHIFFSLSPGGTIKYIKQKKYDTDTLDKAREYWKQQGSPDNYTCRVNQDLELESADYLNAYTSSPELQRRISQTAGSVSLQFCDPTSQNAEKIYGGNCSITPTTADVFRVQSSDYIRQFGLHNVWGQALPVMEDMTNQEGFMEGLKIDEYQLNTYFDSLQKFGNVDKNNVATVLKELKTTYKVDISKPQNVMDFMEPYSQFGIDTLEKLTAFRKQMTDQYPNFLSGTTQDLQFIQSMSWLGYKYDSPDYTNFMNKITDYGIKTYSELIRFYMKMNEKLKVQTNPLEMIGLMKLYAIKSYADVDTAVDTLSTYIYGSGKNQNFSGDYFIRVLVSFGVTSRNFREFMSDSGMVESTDLLQYVMAHRAFGVSYIMNKSKSTFLELKRELNKFILPANLNTINNFVIKNVNQFGMTLEQLANTDAKKQSLKIILYITIGINTFGKYKDLMNDKANKVQHDLSRLVKEKVLHEYFDVDGLDTNMSSKKSLNRLAGRFLDSIQVIQDMGFSKVCSLIDLFVRLRTDLDIRYKDLRPYLESNKDLFQANYSNFLDCGEGFVSYKEHLSFQPIQEGMETANLVDAVNDFGIYDKDEAIKVNRHRWKDIVYMNNQLKRFSVSQPEEYKVFLEELQKFGVDSENMKQYIDMIYKFGVKYENIKDFTIYITKVGVTWSTFKRFIHTLMGFGVRMKDFIQFMCYMYSFGIQYEPYMNSTFYRFIRSMQHYQFDYNGIAINGKSRFINAMDMFVFLLEHGKKKIDCSNPMEIINNPPQVKYIKLYFEEGIGILSNKKIPFPLEVILMTIKTMDSDTADFKNATALDGINGFQSTNPTAEPDTLKLGEVPSQINTNTENTAIPFISYAKEIKNRTKGEDKKIELNENHTIEEQSSDTMRKFIIKFVNSYSRPSDNDMLQRKFITGFMDDTRSDQEFTSYLNMKTITLPKWRELTTRIENWNTVNNGQNVETLNAYNEIVDMLNMMKMFPNFCIKLMEEYVLSDDFNIPNTPEEPRKEMNPKNIRCTPYMKVPYRQQDCPNQSTVMAFTTLSNSNNWNNHSSITQQPFQRVLQQQYSGYSSTPSIGNNLAVSNSSFYSSYDGRTHYSPV